MGWENRKGKLYYYQKERVGNRVVSRYLGRGAIALFEEEIADLRKQRTAQERREMQIARSDWAERARTPTELIELIAEAKRATEAALTAAGYHQHKRGEWRKKRAKTSENRGC
jgi:hypothetical protein